MKNKRTLFLQKITKLKSENNLKTLQIIQAKELEQFHRFAEFGQLSSGLFHDLINPLTAVMLNINKIKVDIENQPNFHFIKPDLEQATYASEKMRVFINSVRKQISPQGNQENFCLNQEIEDALQVLNYKACKNEVCLFFVAKEKIMMFGDPIKFCQIVTNLISNAIDAYSNFSPKEKEVKIDLKQKEQLIIFSVTDSGQGIDESIKDKIFEPFFTTKSKTKALGLGLHLIKKIIEADFLGKIEVISQVGKGTTFTVRFPLT